MQEVAKPAYLGRFPFSGLRCIAPCCAPGGVRVVSIEHSCSTILLAGGTHPKYIEQLSGHASIQLILDGYSQAMPSMGHNTADGMDEALGLPFLPDAIGGYCW